MFWHWNHAKHCILWCAASSSTLIGRCLMYTRVMRRIWMVLLLTCCCEQMLNFRVICCPVARLFSVTIQAIRWRTLWFTRCSQLQLALEQIVLPESTYAWYTTDTLVRENPSVGTTSEVECLFRQVPKIFHSQMHLDSSSYPYCVRLLLKPYKQHSLYYPISTYAMTFQFTRPHTASIIA